MSMSIAEYKAVKKGSKYRNVRTVVDGEKFDSKREAARWKELRLLEHDGQITELKRQQRIWLFVNGIAVGTYVADFTYKEKGNRVCEDVKGYRDKRSPVYRLFKLKAALVKAIHGIEVREI